MNRNWQEIRVQRSKTMLTARSRAITILGLIGALLGLTVWYGMLAPAPALGAYPDEHNLGTDYNQYVGEKVALSGRVVDTDPVVVAGEYGAGRTIRVTVIDLAGSPTEGDMLRVYGVVKDDRTIRTLNAFTVPQWGHWYAWSVSFLAGLWVLARIIRHWRLDFADWSLKPRQTPLIAPVIAHIQRQIHRLRE